MARLSIPVNEVNSFDLPPVCVITGATEGVTFKPVKFSWYPRWIAIFAPFALLPAAILAAVLTRRVKGELPFTEEAYRRWRRGVLLFGLSLFGVLAIPVAAFLVSETLVDSDAGGLVFVVGLGLAIATPVTVWFTLLKKWNVKVVEISKTHLLLEVPSGSGAMAITRHLLGGEPKGAARPTPSVPSVRSVG